MISIKYVYEIRMIELDEYLNGMNRRNIDMDEAYIMIINTSDSECNPIKIFWKANFADPQVPHYDSSRVKMSRRRANGLDVEGISEDGDRYALTCLGVMYY